MWIWKVEKKHSLGKIIPRTPTSITQKKHQIILRCVLNYFCIIIHFLSIHLYAPYVPNLHTFCKI